MAYYYQATIKNMTYRLRKFKDYVDEYLQDYLAQPSTQALIVDMIANNQLYRRGINGEDVKIMEYAPYAPRTIKNKKRKGQPTTRVTLRDTGAFHKAMIIVPTSEGFYITSTDFKTEKLTAKYGNNIFRLTNDNFNRLINKHIRRDIARFIKTKYGIR